MSYEQAARSALPFWTPSDRIIAVAIAAAESGEFYALHGDHLNIFSPAQQAAWVRYSCEGFLSHGPWQVFAGVHHNILTQMSESPDPCYWSHWLEDYNNAAYAAFCVWLLHGGYTQQGWRAWSTYNNRSYERYLERAAEAVRQIG